MWQTPRNDYLRIKRMLSIVGILFFFQCVLAVMFLINLVLGAASAIADQDLEQAKAHFYWGGSQAILSLVIGLFALLLAKGSI